MTTQSKTLKQNQLQKYEALLKTNQKLKDVHIYNDMIGFRMNKKRCAVIYWYEVFENGDIIFNHSYNQNNGVVSRRAYSNTNGNYKANCASGYVGFNLKSISKN